MGHGKHGNGFCCCKTNFRFPADPRVGGRSMRVRTGRLKKKLKAVESMQDHFKKNRGLRFLRSSLQFYNIAFNKQVNTYHRNSDVPRKKINHIKHHLQLSTRALWKFQYNHICIQNSICCSCFLHGLTSKLSYETQTTPAAKLWACCVGSNPPRATMLLL